MLPTFVTGIGAMNRTRSSLHRLVGSELRAPDTDRHSSGRKWADFTALLSIIVAAAVLSFVGLSNNGFWDDEANTALFARNWLRTGTLTAFDGVNVIGFRQGAELNSSLQNVYMPPVQYYVAALGLKLAGSTTFGGRLPFVVAGLLAILLLAYFVKWHLESEVPAWVPVALLAFNPAYLLFIRQCRYYSIVVVLTLAVLAALAYRKHTTLGKLGSAVIAALAAGALMLTNYLDAVALAAILPLFFLLRRYRTLSNVLLASAAIAAFMATGLYILRTSNPLAVAVSYKDTVTGFQRLGRLYYWHITGLARFEFFPIAGPVLALGLLSCVRQVRVLRLVRESFLLCLLMAVYSVAIVIFSPQTVTNVTSLADIRYVVALIPIGAVATACALCAAWHMSPMSGPVLAIVTGAMVLGTNAFTSAAGWAPLRSTLYEYVKENTHDYVTGNEAISAFLSKLQKSYVIRVIPDFMTYPAMFYVPKQHYCCQLSDEFASKNKVPFRLPDYVFSNRLLPDYLLVGADIDPPQLLAQCAMAFGAGRYHILAEVGSDYRDNSRPEIPWHSFGPPSDKKRGFLVLEKTSVNFPQNQRH